MYKFDRMEYPRKYPVPGWMKLAVLIMVLTGFLIHRCWQKQTSEQILISNVRVAAYTRVHVEVEYTLHNTSSLDREVWLLLQVYDSRDLLLGSVMFAQNLKAGSGMGYVKLVDKLVRPLNPDEKTIRATLEVYQRKVI